MSIFHSFLWPSNIPLHKCATNLFIHSLLVGHWVCLHFLATVNIRVHGWWLFKLTLRETKEVNTTINVKFGQLVPQKPKQKKRVEAGVGIGGWGHGSWGVPYKQTGSRAAPAIQTRLKLNTYQRKPTQAFPQRLPHQWGRGRAGKAEAVSREGRKEKKGEGKMFSLTDAIKHTVITKMVV